MKSCVSIKDTEFVIKNLPQKTTLDPDGFSVLPEI
jgi:hypothetical protein